MTDARRREVEREVAAGRLGGLSPEARRAFARATGEDPVLGLLEAVEALARRRLGGLSTGSCPCGRILRGRSCGRRVELRCSVLGEPWDPEPCPVVGVVVDHRFDVPFEDRWRFYQVAVLRGGHDPGRPFEVRWDAGLARRLALEFPDPRPFRGRRVDLDDPFRPLSGEELRRAMSSSLSRPPTSFLPEGAIDRAALESGLRRALEGDPPREPRR